MKIIPFLVLFGFLFSCQEKPEKIIISRSKYKEKLEGFWLGQCIANWTGLITEMDKIGNIGNIKTGDFYTRNDWGKEDLPNIWGERKDSISSTINFVFKDTNEIWQADDDTDIEYMYQYLMFKNKTSKLTPKQIQKGWLKHIKKKEENYLWVSNQAAFDLMQKGVLPPETGEPKINPHTEMIDAQLTTEIFGLFSPSHPEIAIELAEIPIKTVARGEAELIAKFYIVMHALAYRINPNIEIKKQTHQLSLDARRFLPDSSTSAKIFDFVWNLYKSNISWEEARDSVYNRYQVNQKDGYDITSKNLYCNGCFAASINFAASLVSWFYGEGNIKKTIQIGTLAGWDSDNPTATWGGLLGFIYGKKEIERIFNRKFSNKFNIHRTRQNFDNDGIDDFDHMTNMGISVVDLVIKNLIKGNITGKNNWVIPQH